ncbi:Aste57867_23744 [Aphanomyces stellatus]|uniref:Aste57867_23744 protein n=1 Tax=Aphanomyces stellatus TaxID=120398 RepID=A0A485LNG9_9STRA|nr:hypothetical protein As57867_023672 [Aphanomyces stellatus]VFU00389.1 Aste57867_23744 [Aphanomyces stellatus]
MEDDGGAAWDVLGDLHFLIATDDSLEHELAHVWDLLDTAGDDDDDVAVPALKSPKCTPSASPSTSIDSPPPTAEDSTELDHKPKGRRAVRFSVKQREEILILRQQVSDYKDQLKRASSKRSVAERSRWEKAAWDELAAKSKSLRENEELRTAIDEQATFIDYMQGILAKKRPRRQLSDMEMDEAWKSCKLAAHASLRIAAIHAIADRQYARQQSAFINAGVFDLVGDDLFRSGPRVMPDQRMVVEFVYHMTIRVPFGVVGRACWDVFNGKRPPELAAGAARTIEAVDATTVYDKYHVTRGAVVGYANTVRKRYVEADREMIVWRAVLDDALMPSMRVGRVGDEWGWILVSEMPDHTCRLTLLAQVPRDGCGARTADATVDQVAAFVSEFSLAKAPTEPGTFPHAPSTASEKKREGGSGARAFLERGKRLEAAMHDAIEDAIRDNENQSPINFRIGFDDFPECIRNTRIRIAAMTVTRMNVFTLEIRQHISKQMEAAGTSTTAGDELDVWGDLRFLLATDTMLNEDLAYVCDLLDVKDTMPSESDSNGSVADESPAPAEATRAPKRKAKNDPPRTDLKNAFEARQKHELYSLRQQVVQLKSELEVRQALATPREQSAWEVAAREELAGKVKSLQENERLREAVSDQATFIERTQALLVRKKPRVEELVSPDDEWQNLKLAAQQSLRVAAIHAIADRQRRRMQNVFIQSGVFNHDDDVFRSRLLPMGHDRLVMELVEHTILPAPFDVIGHAVWQVFNGERSPKVPPTATQTLETIDANTTFTIYEEATPQGPIAYSNMLNKQYAETDRHVVVWRTVREDARMPHMADGRVNDEAGWCTVQRLGENQCRVTIVVQVFIDPSIQRFTTEDVSVDFLSTLMDEFSFVQRPPKPGMVECAKPHIVETSDKTVATLFRRGKRFEIALKASIRHALDDRANLGQR